MHLNVREITHQDIPGLLAYWLESDDEFIVGMGVDLSKIPSREALQQMFSEQIGAHYKEKKAYALIWEIDGIASGHTNINQIEFGKQAHMHLHLWHGAHRKKGMGTALVQQSLPFYFENYQLEVLYCEPFALNPAPNKTLSKLGFEFIKNYETIPGSINFMQEVNQWKLTREQFLKG
ncbi:MAG: GNAT family N-acetyltransferase [Flavobacteriaceae bacterium]|nr:GNAT family N-acetyltransferase [Flavobacteriaceae bacterium]